jgi:uncharacterized protein
MSDMQKFASLWEWRRRVFDLYAEMRSLEPAAAWTRWRAERDSLFRDHPQTPLDPARRARFGGLSYFDYDPELRYAVRLGPAGDSRPVHFEAGQDGTVLLLPFARTEGLERALGRELTLFWIGGYGGGVFLPFRDATAGSQTYSGGRYLLDTIKGADLGGTQDGCVILDFNFAYNPSCSYSERWVCPLAPEQNRLPAEIRGGERWSPAEFMPGQPA